MGIGSRHGHPSEQIYPRRGKNRAPPLLLRGSGLPLGAQNPPVASARVRSVELDATDRRVLTVGEKQDAEFELILSDTLSSTTPRVLGAVKLSRRPGVGFHVTGVIDEQTCQSVGIALASDPGVPAPAALGDYEWVTFRLGGAPYVRLLNSSNGNTEVLVTLKRRG